MSDLARLLSYSVTDSGNSVTLRTPEGVLVLFDDSPDLDWTPIDAVNTGATILSLPTPSFKEDGEWFAPTQVLDLLAASATSQTLTLPDGRELRLEIPATTQSQAARNSSLVDLGNGVMGLSFYKASPDGRDTLSLLLLDAGLMPLAFPEQRTQLDTVLTQLQEGKPLYFIVTSLADSSWDNRFRIEQDGRALEYSYPTGVSLLEGDATRVTPESPVSGVLLLPDWINLRRPISVTWAGVTATVRYRR